MPRSSAVALLARAWRAWTRVAHWIGAKQALVVYTVLYVVLIGPVALARRLLTDPLQLRARSRPTFWRARVAAGATLEDAERQ